MASYTIPPEVLLCEIFKKNCVLSHRLEYNSKGENTHSCFTVFGGGRLYLFSDFSAGAEALLW